MKKEIKIYAERYYKKPGGKTYWDVHFRGGKHLVTVRDIQTDDETMAIEAANIRNKVKRYNYGRGKRNHNGGRNTRKI